MEKQYSIKVPDEMYVDSFEGNTWLSWTYSGPALLNVEVDELSRSVRLTESDLVDREEAVNGKYVVELDANTYPAVAHYLVLAGQPYDWVYEDETNPDGSIYEKITNPRINDYYELVYNYGGINTREDGRVQGPWTFSPIVKEKRTPALEKVETYLLSFKQKLNGIALESADQTIYDNFVAAAEEYIEDMKTIYPWKYVEITTPAAPPIPVRLIKLVQELGL